MIFFNGIIHAVFDTFFRKRSGVKGFEGAVCK